MLQAMPGQIYQGPLPALTPAQRQLATRLQTHVRRLADQIGPRNYKFYGPLQQTVGYLCEQLEGFGYQVRRLAYEADGQVFENVETVSEGPFTLVGAHYDSVLQCPGANDNASGVAGVLELARLLRDCRDFRFVFFANEEPPFYKTEDMGSRKYLEVLLASQAPVQNMICLETVGYYSDQVGSQRMAFPGMVPEVGNFVALVGDLQSGPMVKELVRRWQAGVPFPCIGLVPSPEGEAGLMQAGMAMSDHATFWEAGIPALMVTDTVFYRYNHYHELTDTWEKLTYEPFARMIEGLAWVLRGCHPSTDT